ncbi:MAG: DUF2599 domain-containing protein [Gordonia sp. (in: high G+C Gram-positive bacteria)]
MVGAVLLLVVGTAAPSFAAEFDDSSDAIGVIASIAPESLEIVSTDDGIVVADEELLEEDDFGRSVVEQPMLDPTNLDSIVRIDIPVNPPDGIVFKQDGADDIVIGLPNAHQADEADYGDFGLATYDNNDGSTTVPIPQPDGTLQITTVIDGPEAPTRYAYAITLPDGGELADVGDGYFAILDSEGLPAAMIEPAWALDANGETVDTHYEVAGNELVQVVNHNDGDAYPIVADPAVKGAYISKVTIKTVTQGKTVAVYPVNSWAITAFDNYWAEYKLYVSSTYEGNKYKNQLRCHWDFAPFKSPWNLDSWRPDVSYWDTVLAGCNP